MRWSTSASLSPTTRRASLEGTRTKPKMRRTPSRPSPRTVPSSDSPRLSKNAVWSMRLPVQADVLGSPAMTVPMLSISNTLDPGRRSSEAIRVFTQCRSIEVVDHRLNAGIDGLRRIGGGKDRSTRQAADRIVADREVARFHRGADLRPVGHIDADRGRNSRALDFAVGADDRHAVDPRHAGGEIGQIEIAGGAGCDHADIGARHHLQHGLRRGDDLALAVGAAARQIQRLGGGVVDAFEAGLFQQAHAVEHQRHDRQQRQNHQTSPDAQGRLAAWRCAMRVGRPCPFGYPATREQP